MKPACLIIDFQSCGDSDFRFWSSGDQMVCVVSELIEGTQVNVWRPDQLFWTRSLFRPIKSNEINVLAFCAGVVKAQFGRQYDFLMAFAIN